jgi:hypothetical protein
MQNTFHNYAKVVETRAERELESVLFWFQNFAIVPVGLFVGFIIAALYSPMFELAGRLGPLIFVRLSGSPDRLRVGKENLADTMGDLSKSLPPIRCHAYGVAGGYRYHRSPRGFALMKQSPVDVQLKRQNVRARIEGDARARSIRFIEASC